MKIIMKTQTLYNNKVLKAGDKVIVDDKVGIRWCNNGIATPGIIETVVVEEVQKEVADNGDISSICGDSRPGGLSGHSSGESASRQRKTSKKSK